MEQMIGYCGNICTDCDAYKAALNNDDSLRREAAAKWSREYNHPFKPENINCDGCLPDTVKATVHPNMCVVRKCGMSKGVKNCGWCDEYSCSTTEEFFKLAPECRAVLDAEQRRAERR